MLSRRSSGLTTRSPSATVTWRPQISCPGQYCRWRRNSSMCLLRPRPTRPVMIPTLAARILVAWHTTSPQTLSATTGRSSVVLRMCRAICLTPSCAQVRATSASANPRASCSSWRAMWPWTGSAGLGAHATSICTRAWMGAKSVVRPGRPCRHRSSGRRSPSSSVSSIHRRQAFCRPKKIFATSFKGPSTTRCRAGTQKMR
mmetsp:Transcript_125244/g.267355  ORF Transcript_125244/g.267355 Transcript_125244/m.267355 type:complete len:201 (-) Transcript_125244:573-1175(-)